MGKLKIIITVLILIWLASCTTSKFTKIDIRDKIAIIPIKGTITSSASSYGFASQTLSSSKIIEFIEEAEKDPTIKGIILEINSPGGTVVASREIVEAIKKTTKPTTAWIRDIGTSGAYWIATAADKIVADPLSITGSIGVSASYLEISKLLEEYGVRYQPLKAGEFKDIASPFKELSEKEKGLLQEKLDKIHQYFIDDVAKNRNLDKKTVQALANGIYYLGEEAKSLNLIDELGSKDLAVNITKQAANIEEATLVTFKEERTILDIISKISSGAFFQLGLGIGHELKTVETQKALTFTT